MSEWYLGSSCSRPNAPRLKPLSRLLIVKIYMKFSLALQLHVQKFIPYILHGCLTYSIVWSLPYMAVWRTALSGHCLTWHTIWYLQTHFDTAKCHPQFILYIQIIIHIPHDINLNRYCHDHWKSNSRTVPDQHNLWSLSLWNLFYRVMSSG
jgi:hypothetical protein